MGDGPTITGGTKTGFVDRRNIDDKTMDKGDTTTPPSKSSFMKSGFEFFKETMSGLKGKSFSEKIQFIGERIEMRKEQKASFKEAVADYNLSLEKKAYMGSLDRKDAEAMRNATAPTSSKVGNAASLLVFDPAKDKGKDLGASANFLVESLLTQTNKETKLTEVEQIIRDNTTGKNEGKIFTKKDAFEVIGKNLALGCSPKELDNFSPKAMRMIAKVWAEDGRTEKAELLNVIIGKFEEARDPKNAVSNYKQASLDHAKDAGDKDFLRLAGGSDGTVQKYLKMAGNSETLADNMVPVWTDMKASKEYKTLQEAISNLLKEGGKPNQQNLQKLSKEGVEALGKLTTTFIAKAIEKGVPKELKAVLGELQEAIKKGDKDVGAKIANLFVNAILKNLTPIILDDKGLHPGSDIKDKNEADRLAIAIATLLQATVTSAFNGTGKVSDPIQIKFKNEILIPLKANIDEFYKAAGMLPEGIEFRGK